MSTEAPSARPSEIPRSERTTGPMSFGQQRLWFSHELEPDAPHNALGRVYAVRGPFDVDAFDRALNEVVRRHETLRTTFHFESGQALQQIAPHAHFPVARMDLSDRPLTKAWQDVDAWLARELHAPFDAAKGPMLGVCVIRLAERDWALVFIQRFIGADRWSRAILHRELSDLYSAFAAGRPSPLGQLPLRYVDFAAWQRERLQGPLLEKLLRFWTEQLRGAPASPKLIADRARASARTRAGDTVFRQLPLPLVERLAAVAVTHRVTPYMLYLAAFQVLLHRHTGDTDIVVASLIAGRLRPETEPLIGYFGNTLVLRTDLSADPVFQEVLGRVRRATLDALAHQELPFERLVEAMQVEREPFADPFARVVFAYQNLPDEPLRLDGCDVREREAVSDTFGFELGVSLYPSATGLLLRAQYQTDLFRRSSIERLLEQFETLLGGVADDVATSISRLPLLNDRDRRLILASSSGPTPPQPDDALLHRLVEEQAGRAPDAIALTFKGSAVSYETLDRRADRLARRLRALGVGTNVVVGLALPRSVDLVVALLAVLKAGGAYLPLETNPPARARQVLEQSGVGLVLSDGPLDACVMSGASIVDIRDPEGHGPLVAVIDPSRRERVQSSGAVSADDLAYVIYTSGSTGHPKGVEIRHRSIVRLATADIVPVGPGDVLLQLTSLSFDVSAFEIWTALAHGARLVLFPEPAFDLDAFESVVRTERVSHLWLTASLFNTIVDVRPTALAGLRYLLVGGEALSVRHVREVLELYPDLRVLNGYGPTEAAVFSLVHEVSPPVARDEPSIPIGRPVAHTTAFVLDAQRQLSAIGTPGELYLGGPGLARGYRNAPELTAERFVEVAIDGAWVQRLYRTGDRVRYLGDGSIEFLGRVDRQVKLRGFRVELDEVEVRLASHPAVSACAVVVREGRTGDARLVAYVVGRAAGVISTAELREHMAGQVPAYMIPAAFLVVDALPATSGGKLDRRALPNPDQAEPAGAAGSLGPATALEEAVSLVWADALGLQAVGPRDNFFEIGGHSLLAVQVVARLRAMFEVALPLSAIFEHPTVAGLSADIAVRRVGEAEDGGVSPAPLRDGSGAQLSFGQRRLWFLHQLDPDSATYNVSRCFRLEGALDVAALRRAFEAMLERNTALRTVFFFDGEEPRQRVAAVASVPLVWLDLASLPADERAGELEARLSAEAARPFDLESEPLMRVLLVRLDAREHVLLMTFHHIATDGWSMGVLGRELGALYGAFTAGQESPLASAALQYVDYAAWQRRTLRGARLEHSLNYWRAQLRGLTPLRLPADFEDAGAATSSARRHYFTVDQSLGRSLRELAGQTRTTLFMILMAAFQIVLARFTGQDDVAVATPIANRTRPEFEQMVGFFVNTLVLRTSLAGPLTGRDALDRVRRAAVEAYDHQECPFESVVEDLNPPRASGRSPLTPVLFALQTAPEKDPSLSGLDVTRRPVVNERVRFDLELFMRPSGDGSLSGAFACNARMFASETIARLARDFDTALRELVAHPDEAVRLEGPASAVRSATGAPVAVQVSGRPAVQPRSLSITEARLTRLWRELLGVDPDPDTDFFALGGHSLLAVHLFVRIETEFGRRLRVSSLFDHGTIRQLAALLDRDSPGEKWTPIVPFKSGGRGAPLFLVHGIGGEVFSFRDLARQLPDDRRVYGIQAPGPGVTCDLPSGIEPLCARYIEAVLAVEPDGPYCVGGYSSGGIMALEMARQLRAAGKEVPLLLLLDGGLPPGARTVSRVARHTPATAVRQAWYWLLDDALRARGRDWPLWLRSKYSALRWRAKRRMGMAVSERLDVRDRLGMYQLPPEYNAYLEERVAAFRRYQPQPYGGPTLLVRSRSGSLFGPPASSLEADWRRLTTGDVSVVSLPCSHGTLLEPPYVRDLALHIQQAIDRAAPAVERDRPIRVPT